MVLCYAMLSTTSWLSVNYRPFDRSKYSSRPLCRSVHLMGEYDDFRGNSS